MPALMPAAVHVESCRREERSDDRSAGNDAAGAAEEDAAPEANLKGLSAAWPAPRAAKSAAATKRVRRSGILRQFLQMNQSTKRTLSRCGSTLNTVLWICYLGNHFFLYRQSEAENVKCCYEVHARSGLRFIIRLQEDA
jgi:hypothetical protein